MRRQFVNRCAVLLEAIAIVTACSASFTLSRIERVRTTRIVQFITRRSDWTGCIDEQSQSSDRLTKSFAPEPVRWETRAPALALLHKVQEAQLMLTTGSTRLAVRRGQQTWYHSTRYI